MIATKAVTSLGSLFLSACERHPERTAVIRGEEQLTYNALYARAAALAEAIPPLGDPAWVGVLGRMSFTSVAGCIAAAINGAGFVPLSPRKPPQRLLHILMESGCRVLVVDTEGEVALPELLAASPQALSVVLQCEEKARELRQAHPAHRFAVGRPGATGGNWTPAPASPNALAYLLFTSGSTGKPKAVGVEHANVTPLLSGVAAHFGITPDDRFSNLFEPTFDPSVLDIFCPLGVGASVCLPEPADDFRPDRYVRRHGITVWSSVPSRGVLLKQMRKLTPGSLPSLRVTTFGGEALLQDLVEAWTVAAPNSQIWNFYGPTEATIACAGYRWDSKHSPSACSGGTVPIGSPLIDATKLVVVDEDDVELGVGQVGELLVTGSQVAPGYWMDPARTEESFSPPAGRTGRWYRTGDLVMRAEPDGPLQFVGRRDRQVQVLGHRVELGEIEAAIRGATGANAAVFGWPERGPGRAEGLTGFYQGDPGRVAELQEELKARLPYYMVPERLIGLEELPLTSHGKVDLAALREWLASRYGG